MSTLDVLNFQKLHAVRNAATSGKLYQLPVDKESTGIYSFVGS